MRIGQTLRLRLGVFSVLALTAFLLFVPDIAFAQDAVKQLDVLDKISIFLAGIVMQFTNFLGLVIALITEVVLVNVMSYNGFATSAVIGAGWAVVRDVMNMGFVIVLLIIAIVTIFGGGVGSWTVKWQQQIPKLLLFAILINFSRMICSFLIDIGQVIMLTFANAIKDIAGGNIIQVFGLADFVTLDRAAIQQAIEANQGTGAFELFISAMLALVMTLIVLGTMVMLTVILVYRIVTLWVLVVISPLAFFFGGAEVLSKGSGNPYADWWQKFTGAVAIGPVLVFFLWLTLSVAGQGNIAATENFPMGGTSADVGSVTGFTSRIADPGRLLSFIIGVGMLYVGFEAAQKFANALPGAASNLVKGGVKSALKIGAGTAAVAGVGAAGVANLGLLKAGAVGAGLVGAGKLTKNTQFGQKARGAVGGALVGIGGKLGNVPIIGGVGRGMARVGTSLEQSRRQDAAKRLNDQSEQVKNYTKDEIDAGLSGKALTPDGVARQNALRAKVLFDPSLRRKYDKDQLKTMFQDFKQNGGEDTVNGDDKLFGEWKKLKKSRIDLLDDDEKADVLSKMENDDFKELDDDALADSAVQAELEKRVEYDREGGDGHGGDMTLKDRIAKGRYGNRLQKAQAKLNTGEYTDLDSKKVTPEGLKNLSEDRQTEANFANLSVEQMSFVLQNSNLKMEAIPADYVRDHAEKIASTVPPQKILELAQSNKGDAFREGLQATLRSGSYQEGKNTLDAAKTRKELTVALVMSSQGSEALGQMAPQSGYMSSKKAFTDDGREAFAEALKRDSSILRHYGSDMKEDGAISGTALENVQVGHLVNAYRGAKGQDKLDLHGVMETIHNKLDQMAQTAKDADETARAKELEFQVRQLAAALTK